MCVLSRMAVGVVAVLIVLGGCDDGSGNGGPDGGGTDGGGTDGGGTDGGGTDGGGTDGGGTDGGGTDGGGTDGGGGDDPPRDSLMRTFMMDAIDEADAINSNAVLVNIRIGGLRSNGTVDLGSGAGFQRRFDFGFWDPTGGDSVSVGYLSEDWAGGYPTVDSPAGSVSAQPAIENLANLPDSDVVATAFEAASGCPTFTGANGDMVVYRNDESFGRGDIIQVTFASTVTRSVEVDTDGSMTEWESCSE